MGAMRLAWFSPMPPARSGVAVCSRELVTALRDQHRIDVFVDDPLVTQSADGRSAHEFPWRHRLDPYDLTVYQIGNSSSHDYLWPYLFRFPGLAVLHDVRLHHARAAALLRRGRLAEYRAEVAANHPELDPGLAEMAIAGFDTPLYYHWPMTRLIARVSRLTAVHTRTAAAALAVEVPAAAVRVVPLGHGEALDEDARREARARVRARWSIQADTLVFGCFGGLTLEKRVPQVLKAFAATLAYAPKARLILGGDSPDPRALRADVHRLGLDGHVVITGYLESDAALTACMAACDAALNLRWPTAGELSGPWLRCLALGLPTVIVDLEHLADVPSLDPRTWQRHGGGSGAPPVCIAIDILDEDHSLALAMRRLATQPGLRASLGRAAADYWRREHAPEGMIQAYRSLLDEAMARPIPQVSLPAHLVDEGGRVLEAIGAEFGLDPLAR